MKGRLKFLNDMVGRRSIYWSDVIKYRDDLARTNMRKELNLLENVL